MEQAKGPRIIAVVNQKGGASKTTLAAQIAYGLARRGKKILAIDMDPQGNLTTALGLAKHISPGFLSSDLLREKRVPGVHWCTTPNGGFHVIPTDVGLAKAEKNLNHDSRWQYLLKMALKPVDGPYAELYPTLDFIIIDSPPNLGLLTINTLTAAQEIIVPITCDVYAFNGLTALTETIAEIRDLNPSLTLMGVVACRVDLRRSIDQESIQQMTEMFTGLLFRARIPENTALKEAGGKGQSIWDYRPGSLAVPAFDQLCDEIIERGHHGQLG